MRRIRSDHPNYELRNAAVRVARKERPCDEFNCPRQKGRRLLRGMDAILRGDSYAYISTGIASCDLHWSPEDVVNAE